MLERTSAPLIIIKRVFFFFFNQRMEVLLFCFTRKSGPGCSILCRTITVHHYSAYSTASPTPDLHNWIFNETFRMEKTPHKKCSKRKKYIYI